MHQAIVIRRVDENIYGQNYRIFDMKDNPVGRVNWLTINGVSVSIQDQMEVGGPIELEYANTDNEHGVTETLAGGVHINKIDA